MKILFPKNMNVRLTVDGETVTLPGNGLPPPRYAFPPMPDDVLPFGDGAWQTRPGEARVGQRFAFATGDGYLEVINIGENGVVERVAYHPVRSGTAKSA